MIPQRVLVPLEHSDGNPHVLEYAGVLAAGFGAEVTVLHVYEPPNSMIGIVPGASITGELAAEQVAGQALLDSAVAELTLRGVTQVRALLERAASPHDAIVRHAREGGYGLIIMGTHGRTGMSRLVMGSVAERVLRDAPCPVLTVHL